MQALQKHFEEAKKNDILGTNVKDEKQRTPLMWLTLIIHLRNIVMVHNINIYLEKWFLCHMLIDVGLIHMQQIFMA